MEKIKFIKPKAFLSIPVALISLELCFGVLAGYFITKYFSGPDTGKKGKIKSIIFPVGKYRLHLHHWILASGALVSAVTLNYFPVLSSFSLGFFGGMAFQGIACYSDWHRILIRKKQ